MVFVSGGRLLRRLFGTRTDHPITDCVLRSSVSVDRWGTPRPGVGR